MTLGSAILLGFIQGVAEFLPISSSGHLSVLQNIFHIQTAENGHMFFDVLLHLGTLFAVIAAYWSDVKSIVSDTLGFIRSFRLPEYPNSKPRRYPGARLLLMMFFATLPLIVVLPINDLVESLYYKTWFIGIAFIITGCILYVSDRMPKGRKNSRTMTVLDAVIIGICQCVATIPGISRSGTTLTAGVSRGLDRDFAMKFSLLLSIPAVLGANILSLFKSLSTLNTAYIGEYLAGMLTAAVSGYFSIILLRMLIRSGKYGRFSLYMWCMGVFTLIASLFT